MVDIHELNEGFIQSVNNNAARNSLQQATCKFESDQTYVFYTTRSLEDVTKVRILYDNKGMTLGVPQGSILGPYSTWCDNTLSDCYVTDYVI